MADDSIQIPPQEVFDRIKVLVETRHYTAALALLDFFEQYREKKEWKHPSMGLLLSYRGLCVAFGKKQKALGLKTCLAAAEIEFYHPDCFLNLGRVYLAMNRRREAHESFERGLLIDSGNPALLREIEKMGKRRPPALSFLPRKSILNRALGKVTGNGKKK